MTIPHESGWEINLQHTIYIPKHTVYNRNDILNFFPSTRIVSFIYPLTGIFKITERKIFNPVAI